MSLSLTPVCPVPGNWYSGFSEETYDVLSQSETYFRKVQIHVIQCDDKVQSDVILTCADDLKAYMEQFFRSKDTGERISDRLLSMSIL